MPLLIDCTLGVPGVRELKNRLDAHAEPGNVPGLQGTPRQPFGTDPKHQMDDDLLRMKSFLETGKLPRDAAEHTAEIPKALKEQVEELRPGGSGTLGHHASRIRSAYSAIKNVRIRLAAES